jgi:hypothetical protein
MEKSLSYGKFKWSYEDFDPAKPCRPLPLFSFSPIRINGKMTTPHFSDNIALALLKHQTDKKKYFHQLYSQWYCQGSWKEQDLGEGRSFYRWLRRSGNSIIFCPHEFKIHSYFSFEGAPKHQDHDEMAKGLAFAICPVKVKGRNIKLYLQDECVMNLLSLPYGEDEDFLELVKEYIYLRFQWEKWNAPAPMFLDWVKISAKRPVFRGGQLGFCL